MQNEPYQPLPLNAFPSTHVYFITNGQEIKIGQSGAPLARMKDLQNSTPLPLQMLGHFRAHPDEEYRLHAMFRHLRVRGEWFRPDPELIAFIDELRAAGLFQYRPPAADVPKKKPPLRPKAIRPPPDPRVITRKSLLALAARTIDAVRRGRLIRMSEVLGLLPAARDVELHDGLMQELRELTAALASG